MDNNLNEMAKMILNRKNKIKASIAKSDYGIKEMSNRAYDNAKNKGFHEEGINNKGEMLLHIIAEVCEAFEADRNNKHTSTETIELYKKIKDKEQRQIFFKNEIKDTFEDEIADAFIRLGDLCGIETIDIVFHILAKMEYNETRPYKHGKKY